MTGKVLILKVSRLKWEAVKHWLKLLVESGDHLTNTGVFMSDKKTVLVVDDNDTIRLLLKLSIQPMGYDVVEAVDGMDGLSKFEELTRLGTPPVLIISDVSMPDMDGLEFIERVRTSDQSTPVLFLTAHSDNETRDKGRQIGANGWLVKPFVAESIRGAITKLLG